MASADPDRYLADQTRAALAAAIDDLDHAKVSGPTRVLARAVLRRLRGLADYENAIAGVERLSREVGEISAILDRCTTSLREAETAEAERLTPSSDVWWNTRTRAVTRELARDRTVEGLSLWGAAWLDGLAAGEWDRCRKLLGLRALPSSVASAADRMRAVTDALDSGEHAAALDPLDGLLDRDQSRPLVLGPGETVRLAVLRARILGQEFSDREAPRRAAADAMELAGDDARLRALALAALAETHLAVDNVEAARARLKEADVARLPVDALVAFGLVLERDGLWAMADEYYDQALAADPAAAARPELLRPVPARLLLRAAQSATLPAAAAVTLLDLALASGVPGEGDHPDREVYLTRAKRLLDLATQQEREGDVAAARASRSTAADSLVEAGRRYAAAGLTPQAVELYEQACSLAPDVAEYRWTYAETLRLQAYRPDGTADGALLALARDLLETGLQLRRPENDEAWVLVTAATIEDNLPDSHYDPALLAERALLLDPQYVLGYAFLAVILRAQGWLQEAFEVTAGGPDPARVDESFLFETHLELLRDLGKPEEALELLDWRSSWNPGGDDLATQRAGILLGLGRAPEALAALADGDPTDEVRLLRGDAMFASGDHAGARDQFSSLWIDTRSAPAAHVAGWAAFRSGHLDDGIQIYRRLAERGDPRTAYTRDLGQMLLVRGDLDEGRELLERGIDACPYAEDLHLLDVLELDYVRQSTASTAHADQVADLLVSLRERIRARIDTIRVARRPRDELAVSLAEGRRHLAADQPLEAVSSYVDVAGHPQVPEVEYGLLRSTRAARQAADELFVGGSHDAARRQWATAEEALDRLPADDTVDLRLTLACRRIVAELIDRHTDDVARWLGRVDVEGALLELGEAAHVLAHDPSCLWALHDSLLDFARQIPSRSADRLRVAVMDRLQIERAYRLTAAEVDSQWETFLSVNSLELRLGPSLEDFLDSPDLAEATADLRSRIEEETGVRIPWLHAVPAPQLPAGRAEVRVYGRWVGEATLDGDRDARLTRLLPTVEGILRSHLYRLVGVDDVALWLKGWDPTHIDAPRWEPADPRADQLRLARVLRMLIRERVSVRDREAIVDVLDASDGLDRRRPSHTLDTLREVRRALGPSALGVGADTVVPVPEELERRIAAGLDPDHPVWVRSREDAHRLVADLRAWLRRLSRRPAAISVQDPLVRPFAWRLLAAEQPPVRVLSAEELP